MRGDLVGGINALLLRGKPILGVEAQAYETDSAGRQWFLGQGDYYSFFDLNGLTSLARLQISPNGTTITNHLSVAPILDFPTVSAGGQQEIPVTLTGAQPVDTCSASPQAAIEAGLTWGCYSSASDTVEVRLVNATPNPITPAPRTWTIDLWQHLY
jgi:hypothetical protein